MYSPLSQRLKTLLATRHIWNWFRVGHCRYYRNQWAWYTVKCFCALFLPACFWQEYSTGTSRHVLTHYTGMPNWELIAVCDGVVLRCSLPPHPKPGSLQFHFLNLIHDLWTEEKPQFSLRSPAVGRDHSVLAYTHQTPVWVTSSITHEEEEGLVASVTVSFSVQLQ